MGNGPDDMARKAHSNVGDHLHNPATARDAAVFQREIVRRYNGGSEFVWEKGDWQILTQSTNRPEYPNLVFKDATPVNYVAVTATSGKAGKKVIRYQAKFEPKNYGPAE